MRRLCWALPLRQLLAGSSGCVRPASCVEAPRCPADWPHLPLPALRSECGNVTLPLAVLMALPGGARAAHSWAGHQAKQEFVSLNNIADNPGATHSVRVTLYTVAPAVSRLDLPTDNKSCCSAQARRAWHRLRPWQDLRSRPQGAESALRCASLLKTVLVNLLGQSAEVAGARAQAATRAWASRGGRPPCGNSCPAAAFTTRTSHLARTSLEQLQLLRICWGQPACCFINSKPDSCLFAKASRSLLAACPRCYLQERSFLHAEPLDGPLAEAAAAAGACPAPG